MLAPNELTALRGLHAAAAKVADEFDPNSPWGGAASGIAREVGAALEHETGEYSITIPADRRPRFREAMELRGQLAADVLRDEPDDDDYERSPEALAFLDSLDGFDAASPEGAWEIKVESVGAQAALAEVLGECVNEAIRGISCEKPVTPARRREFDEEVEEVDFWFGLLGRIALPEGSR